ncbi:MAG TPA: hypothetical protein VGQ23_18425 [Burkholderiaceae bacterium]|jgi:hypothetical protein|nr:hypothetical protein [Burkholderiaceae bacterium]
MLGTRRMPAGGSVTLVTNLRARRAIETQLQQAQKLEMATRAVDAGIELRVSDSGGRIPERCLHSAANGPATSRSCRNQLPARC